MWAGELVPCVHAKLGRHVVVGVVEEVLRRCQRVLVGEKGGQLEVAIVEGVVRVGSASQQDRIIQTCVVIVEHGLAGRLSQ